jgi:FMN phosphatase YigB (HAD superfamily)
MTRTTTAELVFLLDVDNTLLDNDRAKRDLQLDLEQLVRRDRATTFWDMYEEVRRETGCVDVPLTVRRFQACFPDQHYVSPLSTLLMGYPFERYVYPGALDAIAHLKQLGTVAILSDGDAGFQPAKIARAGLASAVDHRVFVFAHKEEHLDEVLRVLPAQRYVMVDDKPRILTALKSRLQDRVFTVHVRQGSYAHAARNEGHLAADAEAGAIGDLTGLTRSDFGVRVEPFCGSSRS